MTILIICLSVVGGLFVGALSFLGFLVTLKMFAIARARRMSPEPKEPSDAGSNSEV